MLGRLPIHRAKQWNFLPALLLLIILMVTPALSAHGQAKTTASGSQKIPSSAFQNLTSYLTVKAEPTHLLLNAKSYALVDGKNGNLLLGLNPNQPAPIGSTTKMVTALLMAEKYLITQPISITPAAAGINGSTIGLAAGETFSLGDLLKGLLIPSGNDVAYSLADFYSQSPSDFQPFVAAMNSYVTAHHLQNTSFLDPAGLNDTGHSSAFDLAQIGRLVMNNPVLSSVVNSSNATITATDRKSYQLKTTDQLIRSDSTSYLPNVIGVKTGFTPAAGYCLVAAEKFHDHLLIGVVLGVPGSSELSSAEQIKLLFNWADQNVTLNQY